MSKSITAQATVTLTLSVKLGSIWGEDCTVGQLTRQATTEAKRMVTEKIGESRNIQIVGTPHVTGIVTNEDN